MRGVGDDSDKSTGFSVQFTWSDIISLTKSEALLTEEEQEMRFQMVFGFVLLMLAGNLRLFLNSKVRRIMGLFLTFF